MRLFGNGHETDSVILIILLSVAMLGFLGYQAHISTKAQSLIESTVGGPFIEEFSNNGNIIATTDNNKYIVKRDSWGNVTSIVKMTANTANNGEENQNSSEPASSSGIYNVTLDKDGNILKMEKVTQ